MCIYLPPHLKNSDTLAIISVYGMVIFISFQRTSNKTGKQARTVPKCGISMKGLNTETHRQKED